MRNALLALVAVGVGTGMTASAVPVEGIDWTQLPWGALACGEGGGERHMTFPEPANPLLSVEVHVLCLGAPAGGDTDCTRTTYGLTGWQWNAAYSAKMDTTNTYGITQAQALAAVQAGLDTWDAATPAEIASTVTSGGKARDAGKYNGINQFGWKRLSPGTIAVTTTWYFTQSGEAVESDAAYSTRYGWSIGGSASTFDLQDIATHELGHTFGLDDLYDSADACLTMYGYGDFGQTHARTLGDGDILGIRAIYG